jgi:hypothetical protein
VKPADDGLRTLRRPPVSPWLHALAGAWVVGMLALGSSRPAIYQAALQEDRLIEWWTVTLFAAAGIFALRLAWRERRSFDALVGGFCVFVAGEEFSWGQRLLGLTPPEAFLEHNRQQELTLHNFADLFGQPKWVLVMALAGFGLVIPAVAAWGPGRRLLARAGATAVRPPAAAWLLAAVALLWWYPLTLTGEWVEALAGGLFLATYAGGAAQAGVGAVAGVALAGVLTLVSGARGGTEAELACARAETEAILDDLAFGAAATGRLAGSRSVHKRVFTSIEDGYVRADGLESYGAVECGADADPAGRRRYAVDPWGSAYWLSVERGGDTIRLVVYSFGPDRRRSGPPGSEGGDDVTAALTIAP